MNKDDIQLYNGDCLELMWQIPDNSVDAVIVDLLQCFIYIPSMLDICLVKQTSMGDNQMALQTSEQEIVNSYIAGETSLRDLATKFNTNHHLIKRVLLRNGVTIVKAKRKPLSEEHKAKIRKSHRHLKTNLGKKMSKASIKKNMATHIKFNIDSSFYDEFEDIEKLKCLNHCISHKDDTRFCFNNGIDEKWYMSYIRTFYYDESFNRIYKRWLLHNKDFWLQPSIDHIVPISKNGTNDINNLQFLTWFENRCKSNMGDEKWKHVKKNIADYIQFD